MGFLLKFLPKEYRNLVELGMRIVENLDTKEERQKAVEMGIQILKDGNITPIEWASFGKALGIWKKGNGKS
jgi:hypothetical protein